MTTHQFQDASYSQLKNGDRVKIAQVYHGALAGWWWPILTVDHVEWLRDDHTALMLHLTEPLPCGDRFVLITGQGRIIAGVRRVVGEDHVVAQYPTPAGETVNITDLGPDTRWQYTSRCTGCPHQDGYRTPGTARRYAQAHAKKCHETPTAA